MKKQKRALSLETYLKIRMNKEEDGKPGHLESTLLQLYLEEMCVFVLGGYFQVYSQQNKISESQKL